MLRIFRPGGTPQKTRKIQGVLKFCKKIQRRSIHDIHDVMFSLIDTLIQNIWQPLLVARKFPRTVFSKQRPPENILKCQYRRGKTSK